MIKFVGRGDGRVGLAPRRDTLAVHAYLVCSECRYAQLYAVQPRAVCTCPGARREGRVVYSGQPACGHAQPRRDDERTLAWCALRAATAQLCFGRIRPHLY